MAGGEVARDQKQADQEGRTIVCIDEAGFYLLPSVIRTYAPGETPVLDAPLAWDHLSVIGAMTPDGKLFHQVYDHAISKVEVVRFLRHLLRHLDGKLTVIWDGLPAHGSHLLKEFLAAGAAQRLHLVQLPGYAPDLNPVEWLWNHLKRVQLGNVCCAHLTHLRQELRKAVDRVRHRTTLITRFFHQPGYL
jgi:transposase